MRILVLTSTYPRHAHDTLPSFVHELARRLPAQGIAVDVLTPHLPDTPTHETMDGVAVTRFRYAPGAFECIAGPGGIVSRIRERPWRALALPFFVAGLAWAYWRTLRRTQYDVVHAHWLIPQGLVAAFCSVVPGATRVPLVCTAHGGDLFALRGQPFRVLRRWLSHHVSHLTVVSQYMREVLVAEGTDPSRITVLPMGVDLANTFRPVPDTTRDPWEILFVGRLVEGKGVHVLIDAFAQLVREFARLNLRIVGDGPERARLGAQAAALGIAQHVRFEGARPARELPAFYSGAAIAVISSIVDEGLGLVTIEAMGCGCAVVASDLRAIREVVAPEINGLLARTGDAGDLVAQIRRLLLDPALRARIVAAADALRTRFDWEAIAAGYGRLIRHAAATKAT